MACVVLGIASMACPVAPDYGKVGENRKANFHALIDDDAFDLRQMVGARYDVVAQALSDADSAAVTGAGRYRSTDDDVMVVHNDRTSGGSIEFVGPGKVSLEIVADGEVVDFLKLEAAIARTVDLGDAHLDESPVDVRLPPRFALLNGQDEALVLRAFDRCNTPLFPGGDALLTSEDPTVASVSGAHLDDGFRLKAESPGATVLSLSLFDGRRVEYDVRVVEPKDVDSIVPMVGGVEGQTAFVWGRAFIDDDELIGPPMRWSKSARILLSDDEGPSTRATVLRDVEGVDAGSALITARFDDRDAGVSLDLFAVTEDDVVNARVAMPEPAAAEQGCEDNAGLCDPFAAVLFGALGLRRKRAHRR